ncbi:MAG: DUF2007 domain-containing protein [Saprospiraceae bacterium]|nr:DUF2007 domain-containing protein [Saprospiraceae bacterium]
MANTNILDDFEFEDNQFFEDGNEGEVVAKYYSSMEAEVAAARLRSEGIPCFLANTISQSVLPHIQFVLRLHTRPQDVERAREILSEAAAETSEFKPRSSNREMARIIVLIIGSALLILLVRIVLNI